MSRFAGGGRGGVPGRLGLSGESAGVQAPPSLAPPWHLIVPAQEPAPAPGQSASLLRAPPLFEPALQVWLQTGQLWIPGAFGKRSPVRKSSELSGRLRLEAPLAQSAVPVALADTELMTHRLIGVVAEFGIGSGGPNRHPTLVRLRSLAPGSVALVLVSVSAVPLQSNTVVSEVPMSGTWNGSRSSSMAIGSVEPFSALQADLVI